MSSFAKLGLLDELIEGVIADAPDAAQIERVRNVLTAQIGSARDRQPRSVASARIGGGAEESRGVDRSAAAARRTMGRRVMRVCAAPPFDAALTLRGSTSRDARWRPHDLLRLARLASFDEEPAWARDAFARAPFVVVRRALRGRRFRRNRRLRGAERAQRYGTWAHRRTLKPCPPERSAFCATAIGAIHCPRSSRLPRFFGSDSAGALNGFVWGPTGSAGFELATHVPTVTTSSDLDLLDSHTEAAHTRLRRRHSSTIFTRSRGVSTFASTRNSKRPQAASRSPNGPRAKRACSRATRAVQQLIADPWAAGHRRGFLMLALRLSRARARKRDGFLHRLPDHRAARDTLAEASDTCSASTSSHSTHPTRCARPSPCKPA